LAIDVRLLLARLVRDEEAQDLIEYALLGSFVGLVGAAAFASLKSAIALAFTSFNSSNNNNWQMPDPGSGS
jgi:Flp pilus assembly pilin Flp